MGKEKLRKRSRSDSSSSSSSDSSQEKKKLRKLKKKLKKEQRKTEKALKKKLKEEKRKLKKQKHDSRSKSCDTECNVSADIPLELMERSKAMAPMTKEEWDKRQSIVRKVHDEETGRYRLIKGDGEVLEEIVPHNRHREINRQATMADGDYFQAHTVDKQRVQHLKN